ncbi:MAG: glucose-6-phosphate isomerase family protein [Candidatus Korarchaeota archaeon]|nr:glucose-6-phosphate isomerase family protein [Candidatus Korarchaeota archaeon]
MMIAPGVEYREGEGELLVQGEKVIPSVRRFFDLLMVLEDPSALKEDGDAYLMYRDLPPLRARWVRFDVTIIPPWMVGREYAKTKGHYHMPPSAGRPSYPEIYQVHSGNAIYLLQRAGPSLKEIVDFIVVRASPGDVVVIPPNYGHVTVNPGEETLVMSNLIYRGVESDYEPYERLRGAAYYYTIDGFIRNGRYSSVPEIREGKPLWRSQSIAIDFLEDESSFSWLKDVDRACEEGFLGVRC